MHVMPHCLKICTDEKLLCGQIFMRTYHEYTPACDALKSELSQKI
jgi:hypothetical protein